MFASSATEAAAQAKAQSKCPQADASASAVRIEFDRVSEDESGKKAAILRLVNGSDCKIYIGVQDPSSVVFEGVSRDVQTNEEVPDGAEIEPHYSEQELRDSEWKDTIMHGGCVSIPQRILPGRSVLFRVPLEIFQHYRNVRLFFNFVGEDAADVWHDAVFSWSAVPGV
jgi:hypothetical protein